MEGKVCLPRKPTTWIQSPEFELKQTDMVEYTCKPSWGDTDRWIPGVHRAASLPD